jgi:hypothetical protein
MTNKILTQAKLKEILNYDPDTGIFKWIIKPRRSRINVGTITGKSTSNGYPVITYEGKQYQAHRLSWLYVYGVFPKNETDHINHIRDDNRIVNLREATGTENQMNRSCSKNNKSGHTGVNWIKLRYKWRASIMVNNKKLHLGYFTKKKEAIEARKAANIKYNFHTNHGL